MSGCEPVDRHCGGIGRRRRQRSQLRVRIVVQRGVAVDDPDHPLVHDRRVHGGVGVQPRRHRLDPLGRITFEQDLAVGPDHIGEQEVSLGELGGEHAARQPVAHRDTAAANVGVVLGLDVGLVVVLAVIAVLADDRVVLRGVGDHRAEVDARLVQRRRTGRHDRAVGAHHAGQELGISAVLVGVVGDAAHGVGRRGDEAVAMRVDGVPVDPVALVVDQPVRVEFAGRHDVVAQVAVGALIAVDVQLVGEVVKVLALLELGERRADDVGIEQPDVRRCRPVGGHLLGGGLGIGAVVAVGDGLIGQPVGLSGRDDTSADVLAFLLRGIGFDADLLDDQRPARADDQRRQQQQHHADGRNSQVPQTRSRRTPPPRRSALWPAG